jgi:hypothetical protein
MQRGADPWQAAGYLDMSLECVVEHLTVITTPTTCPTRSRKSPKAKRRPNESRPKLESFLGR